MKSPTWPLADDSDHAEQCHQRWYSRINRNPTAPDYQNNWYREQCMFCRFYIRLAGALAEDWGVCSNQAAEFDGRVRFEHDGCSHFAEVVEGTPE